LLRETVSCRVELTLRIRQEQFGFAVNPGLEACSDEALARATRRGDLRAFEELVYRYEARIYRFVRQLCGDESAAREVTQDVFVRAFQALEQFDPEKSLTTWLFTIARRKSIDRYRANRLLAEPRAELPETPDQEDPARVLARREAWEDIWEKARGRLPELQFQVLWLRYGEDLAIAEIAQVLGRTQTHVKVALFRARTALAKELREPEPQALPGDRIAAGLISKGIT
jgi:RNA polymerase sigma-70 factor, ECF subfamily